MSENLPRVRPRLPRLENDAPAESSLRPSGELRPSERAPMAAESGPAAPVSVDVLTSDADLAAFVKRLQEELSGNEGAQFQGDDTQRAEYIRRRFEQYNDGRARSGKAALPSETATLIISKLLGFGFLEPYLRDPKITEIMVNGSLGVCLEQGGQTLMARSKPTEEEITRVAARLLAQCNRAPVSEARPFQDGFLPELRVNVVHSSVTPQGTVITIRKHRTDTYDLPTLVKLGSLPREAAETLDFFVIGRASLMISGGTGSGKTTTVNALLNAVPRHERLVVVEDARELLPKEIPNRVSLTAQPDTPEAKSRFTIRDAVRQALRMRPSRIVVGEVRGGEALDMLWAMNTGHEGSMTTLHANSARDALNRLEMYCFEGAGENFPQKVVRRSIASGIDILVHIARLHDGSRRVVEIAELVKLDEENGQYVIEQLWTYDKSAGELRATGRMISADLQDRMRSNGVNIDRLRRVLQREDRRA